MLHTLRMLLSSESLKQILTKTCDVCGAELNDSAQLSAHQSEQHRKSFCGPCKAEFNTQRELYEHVKKEHGIKN
jgi:hypothetical protein